MKWQVWEGVVISGGGNEVAMPDEEVEDDEDQEHAHDVTHGPSMRSPSPMARGRRWIGTPQHLPPQP